MSRLVSYALRTALVAAALFAAVLAGELYCRVAPSRRRDAIGIILSRWRPRPSSRFALPIPLFANRGAGNAARLRYIVSSLPIHRPRCLRLADIGQSPARAKATLFEVRLNSLGFRNPEYSIRKPAHVYRIVVLGAYHAFGQGVENEEAYPRQLERLLNRRGGRLRFEVWNGGLPAVTAIVGLARLRYEVLRYRPDLLILNYCSTDRLAIADNPEPPVEARAPAPRLAEAIILADRWIARTFRHRSYFLDALLSRAVYHYAMSVSLPWWEDVTRKTIVLARSRNIPVILLDRYRPTAYRPFFQRVAAENPDVEYVRVDDAYREHPPTRTQIAQFPNKYRWLDDLPEAVAAEARRDPFCVYYVNWLFPNAFGHLAIAEHLAAVVERRLAATPRSAGE